MFNVKALNIKLDSISKIPRVKKPILLIHGTEDRIIPFELGKKLYEAAESKKMFRAIEGAGHNNVFAAGGATYLKAWQDFLGTL